MSTVVSSYQRYIIEITKLSKELIGCIIVSYFSLCDRLMLQHLQVVDLSHSERVSRDLNPSVISYIHNETLLVNGMMGVRRDLSTWKQVRGVFQDGNPSPPTVRAAKTSSYGTYPQIQRYTNQHGRPARRSVPTTCQFVRLYFQPVFGRGGDHSHPYEEDAICNGSAFDSYRDIAIVDAETSMPLVRDIRPVLVTGHKCTGCDSLVIRCCITIVVDTQDDRIAEWYLSTSCLSCSACPASYQANIPEDDWETFETLSRIQTSELPFYDSHRNRLLTEL